MADYPELESGARTQYPLRKARKTKARRYETPGGATQVLFDAGAEELRWELEYAGLTEDEATRLRTFFEEMGGGLKEFTFCDPTANLLTRSNELTHAVWNRGGMVAVVGGVEDPMGGSEAWRVTNHGQTSQRLSQTLSAGPATYCVSCWLRAASERRVRMVAGDVSREVVVETQWRREWVGGKVSSAVELGLELEAGSQVEAFGMQADAQPAPAEYRESKGAGGVYARTRFAQDALVLLEDAPGVFRTRVALVSKAGGR